MRVLKKLALLGILVVAAMFAAGLYRDANPGGEVERLVAVLGLQTGSTVAEIGAGSGRMTVLMAEEMAPAGRVYATELSAENLDKIRDSVSSFGSFNITVLGGREDATGLPPDCCDAIFLTKVYHHLTKPAAMNRSLFEALRRGGRLAVVDFEQRWWRFWLSRPHGVPENRGGHGMPLRILLDELTRAGFVHEKVIEDWWSWPESRYCVIVRKP